MTVVHPGATKAISLAVRQAYADLALLDAIPAELPPAHQRTGQVFWSWLDILEPFQGTLALAQPVDLAQEVASAILNSQGEEIKLDEVLDAQCEVTNILAGRAFTALAAGKQVRLGTPSSGQGAPDVRKSGWLGQSFTVGESWVTIYLSCPALFDSLLGVPARSETSRLGPSEAKSAETESVSAALEAKPDSPGRASVRGSFVQERRKVVAAEEVSSRIDAPVARSEIQRRSPDNRPAVAVPLAPAAPAAADARIKTPLPPEGGAPPGAGRIAGRPADSGKLPVAMPARPVQPASDESGPSSSSSGRSVVRTIAGLRPVNASTVESPSSPGARAPYQVPRPVSTDRFAVPARIGHYQLLDQVGAGPAGLVFKAQQTTLGRMVALKVMTPELAQDPVYLTRFLEEARIAASLEHPQLVTVYDAGHEDGFLYIAMRFYAQGDLGRALERSGVLDESQAIALFADCLRGLKFLHERGHVHGNLHPGNILLDELGSPHIVDFGVVRQTAAAVDTGTRVFTAPERSTTAPSAAIHDLYALGACLYTALTGQAPYPETANVDTYIMAGAVADVRLHAPQVSQALCQVVAKAIHLQPAKRYQDAKSFLDELLHARSAGDPAISASGVKWFDKLFGGKGPKE
jgi:tRNA A-37 threonylcarbamoyl transferase component Bud32/chemotaxis protein CheY-P-specific phosphatase CheC